MLKKGLMVLSIPMLIANQTIAQEAYSFTSPSFSGIGYSSHVLMLEQITQQNQKAIDDKEQAAADAIQRELDNSNLNKFLKNVESRIYAQISKQLVDAMFGDNPSASGSINLGGNTVEYYNDGTDITLTITDADGYTTTIVVPVGDFGI